MRKTNTLNRWPDFDQKKLDNKKQTIFKIRPIQLYKVDKGDKWQRELEDIEDYVNKEAKRIAESKEIK